MRWLNIKRCDNILCEKCNNKLLLEIKYGRMHGDINLYNLMLYLRVQGLFY